MNEDQGRGRAESPKKKKDDTSRRSADEPPAARTQNDNERTNERPFVQGAGVRERLRMSFSSAQRLARAGGWDAALRVGLGSRGPAATSVLLRGAEGKIGSFGRPGLLASALGWWWREGGRSGEMAARDALVLVCVVSASGDGGRTGVDVSKFRGRGGMGLDR